MSKLEVEQVGRSEWPRWVIKDTNQRFFTGSGWTLEQKQALLFADRTAATAECSRLDDDFIYQVFLVNLQIELLTQQHLSKEEIKEYIAKQIRMEIDCDGEHPCSDDSFDLTIDWDSFRTH